MHDEIKRDITLAQNVENPPQVRRVARPDLEARVARREIRPAPHRVDLNTRLSQRENDFQPR